MNPTTPPDNRHASGRRAWWVVIPAVLALLMVVGGLRPQPAAAQAQPNFAIWIVDLIFPNNTPEATLTVKLGTFTPTGPVILQTQAEKLNCQTIGNLAINNGTAIFTGSEFVRCRQPNINQIVLDMTNGGFSIPPSCEAKKPFVLAWAAVDPLAPAATLLPLYHHQPDGGSTDMVHAVRLNLSGNVRQGFQVAGEGAFSSAFSPSGGLDRFGARFRQINQSIFYQTDFKANGTVLSSNPAVVQGPLPLSTGPAVIHYGYNPDTGEYFQGALRAHRVDPPCIGSG